jgi:hypothetical protein
MEERVPEKAQQEDQTPVTGLEGGAKRPGDQPRHYQDDGRDGAAEGGEGDGREERLGRLDGGIATAPEQDGEEEKDWDDGGVSRPGSRGADRARQRVFMSSGKLEEKE